MSTGEIEVCAESLEVLNTCRRLPFEIKDFVKASCLLQGSSFHASFLKAFHYIVLRSRGVSILSFPIRLPWAFTAAHSFLSLRVI